MSRRTFPAVVLGIADLLTLWLAFEMTAWSRVALNQLLPHNNFSRALVESLFPPLPLVALSWLATLFLFGAYDVIGKRSLNEVGRDTAKAVTVAMALQIVVMFFVTRTIYSRSVVVLFWGTSLVLLTLSRQLLFHVLRRLKARGIGAEPVAVVGTGPMARLIADKIAADTEPRFRFMGYLSDQQSTAAELDELGQLEQLLGSEEKVEHVINELGLRRLFVSSPARGTKDSLALLMLCDRMEVGLERVPDLLGIIAERVRVTEIDGLPLLSFRPVRFTRWQEAVKRTVDLFGSAMGLLLLAPVFALTALAVRLDSRGPVLFAQRRVGRGGKHFRLLKFRSMRTDAEDQRPGMQAHNEADGHIFKIKGDPRITRVGAWLRRLSIDELPQLWNVLVGEMSLVGPRPLPKDDVENPDSPYSYWISRRRTVRPGITGLWQVSGRSQLPFEEMVNLDLHYMNGWSLGLDVSILLRTLPAVLKGDGAY